MEQNLYHRRCMLTNSTTIKERGFTIVEVAIIVPLISLMVAGLVTVLVTLVTSIGTQTGRNTLTYETRAVFDQIEKDVSYGSTFIDTTLPANFNSTTFPSDSSKSPNSYTVGGSAGIYVYQPTIRTLLIKSYDQSKNPNGTSSTIPTALGVPPCTNQFDVSTNNTLPLSITYFVDKGILYRRVTPDNTAGLSTCTSPIYKKNCPSTPADCSPNDTALASGITRLAIDYYLPGSNTPMPNVYSNGYSGTGISQADSIGVSITAQKRSSGAELVYTTSARFTRAN